MKRNIKSQLLTVLLAVAMLIGLMPNTVHAGGPVQDPDASLYIGGNSYDIKNNDLYTSTGEYVDPTTGILNAQLVISGETLTMTLNGYEGDKIHVDNTGFQDINIILVGTNTINVEGSNYDNVFEGTGIYVKNANLSISGTGSLVINIKDGEGIYVVDGGLAINDGILDIDNGGINVASGILNIENGTLNITSKITGIFVSVTGQALKNGAININGGSVTVNSTNGAGIVCNDGSSEETLTIGENITKVDITGGSFEETNIPAIIANVKNAITGTGIKADGTTESIATSEEGQDLSSYQNVTFPEATVDVTGVELKDTSITLTEGDSKTLEATVKPENASDKTVTWESSNPEVATVDKDGKVTAIAEGTATITVTATNGTDIITDDKTATCTVTVKGYYECNKGNNQSWTIGSSSGLSFTFDSDEDDSVFANRDHIEVDNKIVDASNYTEKEGSWVLELKSSYLETLTPGEHTLTAYFKEGKTASAKFATEKKSNPAYVAPKTGVE